MSTYGIRHTGEAWGAVDNETGRVVFTGPSFESAQAWINSDALSAWESEGGYSPPEPDPSPYVASQSVTATLWHDGYHFIGGHR